MWGGLWDFWPGQREETGRRRTSAPHLSLSPHPLCLYCCLRLPSSPSLLSIPLPSLFRAFSGFSLAVSALCSLLGISAVMQMKKARRALLEASRAPLPPPYPVVGDDGRARFRLHSLMQDYEELVKDTATKRKRLQMGRQKLLNLNHEVKFLQRRYEHLMKNSSSMPYKVKTHSHPQKAPSAMKQKAQKSRATFNTQPREYAQYGQLSQHDSSCRGREVAGPSTLAILDLNRVFLPVIV